MSSRGGRLTPYLVGLPGGLWLGIFFVVPILVMLSLSLQSGNAEEGFRFTWAWSNYADAWEFYHTQFVRSIIYGLIVTVLCLVLAYPMAYWIAFYGGSRKSTYLFLILLPFFVSFVIRTASWKFILNDEGFVFGPLKDAGLLPGDFHILATSTAVIGGLTVTTVEKTRSGIPLLSSLPLIGSLFSFSSTAENRKDLIILVTPRILGDNKAVPES